MSYANLPVLPANPKRHGLQAPLALLIQFPSSIPCHRIIRSNGTLEVIMGGSDNHPTHSDNVARKALLLQFESSGPIGTCLSVISIVGI